MMKTNRLDYDGADIRQSCTRKKAISDEKVARKIVNTMKWEGKRATYYACRHCGQFHIGRDHD